MEGDVIMDAIKVKNLTKSYSGFKLNNVSFTLPSGCIMGLVGENGAGKSTTIKLILDMIKKDSGEVEIFGQNTLGNMKAVKEDIGVVLDDVGIPDLLKAGEVGKIMKYSFKNWSDSDYAENLKRLSIPANKPFKEFSRGMKMKLGIAIALSHNAKLLILDEATSGLDPVVRDDVLNIFNEFTRDENHSILISSHIVSDLEKLCDYIAFLHKGKLMLFEEKDALISEYGVIHCPENRLSELEPGAVIHKSVSPYGAEAIVKRGNIPSDLEISPVSIEDLFVQMAKEEA